MKAITRKKLMELGATSYQATMVTKDVKVVRKLKRQNVYSSVDVLRSCDSLSSNEKLRAATRAALENLLTELLSIESYLKDIEYTQEELSQWINSAQSQINPLVIKATTENVVSFDKWKKARA